MRKIWYLTIVVSFITFAQARDYVMTPDGKFVQGNTWTMAPNGKFVGGNTYVMTPDGKFIGKKNKRAKDEKKSYKTTRGENK